MVPSPFSSVSILNSVSWSVSIGFSARFWSQPLGYTRHALKFTLCGASRCVHLVALIGVQLYVEALLGYCNHGIGHCFCIRIPVEPTFVRTPFERAFPQILDHRLSHFVLARISEPRPGVGSFTSSRSSGTTLYLQDCTLC